MLLFQASIASAQLVVVTFGDSLTHNDLLGWFYGKPQDLYGNDPMQAVYIKAASAGDRLDNYAVAGSHSAQVNSQINLYNFGRTLGIQPQADVIGYEIGGNNILANIDLLSEYGVGENATADAVIDRIISDQANQLSRLASSHPGGKAVLWTIPDITLTPQFYGLLTPRQIANVQAHTARANEFISSLTNLPNAVVIDLYALISSTVNNPPVIMGDALLPPPAMGAYDNIFADSIHPTAVSNAVLANEIIVTINAKWGLNIPLYSEQELAELAHIN